MKAIINDNKNTLYTESSLNQSKGDSPLTDWMDRQNNGQEEKNAERFEVNRKKAKAADKKARKFINEEVARKKLEHYAVNMTKDSLSQGGATAVRQALGVVFTELTMTIWDEIPNIRNKIGNEFSAERFFESIIKIVENGFVRVRKKMQAIFDALINGFMSGFINSIVTTIINIFLTTGKNLVRVIRQAMTSITEAVRILFFNKENRSPGDRLLAVVKILLTGAATVMGVILEQALSETLSASGLAAVPVIGSALAEAISVFSGILITGILSVTFLYVLDNSEFVKKIVAFIDYLFADGVAKAREKMEAANQLLDEYIAKLSGVDVGKLKEEVSRLHALNFAVVSGDINSMYSYCFDSGINLQFDSEYEFVAFMEDDDSILEI